MLEQLPSLLIAAVVFGLLVFMRTQVFQIRSAAVGGRFLFGSSLRMMLRVLSSLLLPGLGQATSGRMTVAFWHLGVFIVALYCFGETAFLINIISAMEHAFS